MDALTIRPTDEQLAIIDTIKETSSNVLVNALAGTGKTTTLDLIQSASPKLPVLCLAFNKSVAEEATKRFPSTTTVRTFNSLGHRVWAKTVAKVSFENKKMQNILKEEMNGLKGDDRKAANEAYWEIIGGVSMAKSLGYVPSGCFPNAIRLIQRGEFHASLDERPSPLTAALIDACLVSSIKAAYQGFIDYNDQIFMPALFGGSLPRFPFVLVDEYQDLSPTNHAMLDKLVRGRIAAVGDYFQCHPSETLIYTTNRGQVPINELKKGEEVATLNLRKMEITGLKVRGRKVEEIISHPFEGELVTAYVGDKTVRMTPNHRCLVQIRDNGEYVLYAMKKGDYFRIGCCKLKYAEGTGIAMRAIQEGAEAAWILEAYPDRDSAREAENEYSQAFNVTQLMFSSHLVRENIANGIALLRHFGRDVWYPIWDTKRTNYLGRRGSIVHACNLVPEIMHICVRGESDAAYWLPVQLSREAYSGLVYGITVEPCEGKRLYLANDIVVHNCIYGFRGVESQGRERLREKFKMQELGLSISFRCPEVIVKAAQWRVPHFKWMKPGGRYEKLQSLSALQIPDGAAIICRNNAPLFKLAFGLLAGKRSVQVAGSEIGPRIVRLMRKFGDDDCKQEAVIAAISNWKHVKMGASNHPQTICDMAACMQVFASFGTTLGQAIAYAEHLFKQQGTIKLATGHKAKGLEWNTVYHLDPWLLGDRNGNTNEQDLNLRYVITTRAAKELYEIDSRNIKW